MLEATEIRTHSRPASKSDDVSTSDNFEIGLSHVVEREKLAEESAGLEAWKWLAEELEPLQSTGFVLEPLKASAQGSVHLA